MALPPSGDTIAAISTAPGVGAIGIVRVSGPGSLAVADAVFRPASRRTPSELPPARATLGRIVDRAGCLIDEALLLTFHGPRSYTGQDVVELHTHGGTAVLQATLDACLAAGARPAGPGEFTLRAYLAGRIDLVQAESVLGLIEARSDNARRSAALGLSKALTERLDALQTTLTTVYANLQAVLDYPEEGLEESETATPLQQALAEVDRLLATARAGRLSQQGARLALVGRPNAGKSSLLNSLLGYRRSIVSDTPGTTRDYLEAPLELGGVPITAIDTAGIRDSSDPVEAHGVRASLEIARNADLVLCLLDASRPLEASDGELVESLDPERTVLVASKADLPRAWSSAPFGRPLPVSAVTGAGVPELQERIRARLLGDAALEELWVGTARQEQALRRVRERIESALLAPEDLAALDLEDALRALGQITGREGVAEEALAEIFANFCVGK